MWGRSKSSYASFHANMMQYTVYSSSISVLSVVLLLNNDDVISSIQWKTGNEPMMAGMCDDAVLPRGTIHES